MGNYGKESTLSGCGDNGIRWQFKRCLFSLMPVCLMFIHLIFLGLRYQVLIRLQAPTGLGY